MTDGELAALRQAYEEAQYELDMMKGYEEQYPDYHKRLHDDWSAAKEAYEEAYAESMMCMPPKEPDVEKPDLFCDPGDEAVVVKEEDTKRVCGAGDKLVVSKRLLGSPKGECPGRGGWLEHNGANEKAFRSFFDSEIARIGLTDVVTCDDLMISSTTITKKYPSYKELPPRDLWPNMPPTLEVLKRMIDEVGAAPKIASGYRSKLVNLVSAGAVGSAHLDFAGLDLLPPKALEAKMGAWIKWLWWTEGRTLRLGLGYYRPGRFHIDAGLRQVGKGYRRWEWKGETKATSRTNYEKQFGKN